MFRLLQIHKNCGLSMNIIHTVTYVGQHYKFVDLVHLFKMKPPSSLSKKLLNSSFIINVHCKTNAEHSYTLDVTQVETVESYRPIDEIFVTIKAN